LAVAVAPFAPIACHF